MTADDSMKSGQAGKKLLRKCPVCLNDNGEVLHHQSFATPAHYLLPASYDIVSCSLCGFVYADTKGTQADYDRFYRECSKYEDASVATGCGALAWDAQRMEGTASEIAGYIGNPDARILDVGCASGGLLAALKRKGYCRLTGLDPSEACAAHIRKKGIAAVEGGLFSAVLSDPGFFPERFDLIILSHVLEHVCDLRTALNRVATLLEDEGSVYVEVPDASRYGSHYVVPYYYFDCEHINHFDGHSLVNLFQQFGCSCMKTGRKEILVSRTVVYPAVYAFFGKCGAEGLRQEIQPDFSAKESVREHIRQSASGYNSDLLEELVRTQRRIIVWGAGSYTLRLLEDTPLGRCNIAAYVDNDSVKQGTSLQNIMIHSPQILKKLPEMPIVVCAALHSASIVDQMRKMGICNDVVVL